jgi:hypothetical protein
MARILPAAYDERFVAFNVEHRKSPHLAAPRSGARPGTSLGRGAGGGRLCGVVAADGAYLVFTKVPWPTLIVAPQTLHTR